MRAGRQRYWLKAGVRPDAACGLRQGQECARWKCGRLGPENGAKDSSALSQLVMALERGIWLGTGNARDRNTDGGLVVLCARSCEGAGAGREKVKRESRRRGTRARRAEE